MAKILGIDYGEVRVGIAISDVTETIASPKEHIDRRKADLFDAISRLIKENNIEKIVVGLPLNLKGRYSHKTTEVKEFIDDLSEYIDIPVEKWDERFSTVSAERTLREANIKGKKRRKYVDSLSAQIILQNYLDSKKL